MANSFRWTRLNEHARAYQSLNYVVASWEGHNNVYADNAMIIFIKKYLREMHKRGENDR